jgi:uncharacterized damage-inducible protein DinB
MNGARLFGHWETVRAGLLEALQRLDDEQLHFVPGEGLWSLGKVAGHIANAEEGWFRYVVQGELAEWPKLKDEEFETIDSVVALMTGVHDRTLAYLATLKVEDMEHVVKAPWGAKFPIRWVIWHVLEHEIHHRGEIYLMLGLMGLEAPDV